MREREKEGEREKESNKESKKEEDKKVAERKRIIIKIDRYIIGVVAYIIHRNYNRKTYSSRESSAFALHYIYTCIGIKNTSRLSMTCGNRTLSFCDVPQ